MTTCAVERCPIPAEPPIPLTFSWPSEAFGLPIGADHDTVTFEVPLCIFHREAVQGGLEALEVAAALHEAEPPEDDDALTVD